MNSGPSKSSLESLLAPAVHGDGSIRQELLLLYRPYLRLVAGQRLPRRRAAAVDASDIVQQTLVDAVRGCQTFAAKRNRNSPPG